MSWLDLLFRRRSDAGGPGTAMGGEASTELEVLGLDANGWRAVRLDIGASRVSDALNDAARDVRPRLADGTPVELDDFLLLVPPPQHSGDPARRLHRPPHQLWVRTGGCWIVGSLHLPPGVVGSAYLLRRNRRFFVLTDATIRRELPDAREERFAPVLLVNLQQVSSLRDTPEPEVAPAPLPAPPA